MIPTTTLLVAVAIFLSAFWLAPANALSVDSRHFVRHHARTHDAIALNKRSNSTARCRHRPSAANSTTALPSHTPSPSKNDATSTTSSSQTSSSQTSSSTSQKAAATTPSSGGTSKSKVGIAWANGDDPSLQYYAAPGRDIYTWSPTTPSNAAKLGFNFLPMLWCDDQIADFVRLVVEGYATTALGMNEPNESGQCNITPEHGAQLWKQYIQPLAQKGYRLIAPATSSAPSGKQWMIAFFAACSGCTFDGMGAHYYDVSAQGLIDYMTDFYQTFHLPILITEFACQNFNGGPQCTENEIFAFMSTVVQFCQSTSWIDSCYAFGIMHNLQGVNPLDSLMNSDGTPSALGQLFLAG